MALGCGYFSCSGWLDFTEVGSTGESKLFTGGGSTACGCLPLRGGLVSFSVVFVERVEVTPIFF